MKKSTNLEELITEAYDQYLDAIFRFCYFKTKDRELSKDLAQQTFFKTWHYLQTGHQIDDIRPFLYKTANNLIIDWYRKQKKESLDSLLEQGFDPVDPKARTEDQAEVEVMIGILNKLPAAEKELILEHYVDNRSIQEISQRRKQTKNVIYVKIHRAREKLKKIIYPQKHD